MLDVSNGDFVLEPGASLARHRDMLRLGLCGGLVSCYSWGKGSVVMSERLLGAEE